jgi:hypothetical protein
VSLYHICDTIIVDITSISSKVLMLAKPGIADLLMSNTNSLELVSLKNIN